MLVLRAFRDAGGVSAGSPRLQTGGLQVCLWQTSSAQSCGLRRGASQPSSGGAVVKAAVRVSSGVPPSLFPFGLSARRRAERFGRWGHPESLLEQADWGGVAGAGVRAGGAKTGSRSRSLGGAAAGRPGFRGGGLFPRRQRQFRSGRAKKQATKRRTKKDFPSPKRRRFVKTGFFARYKEARRSGRPRGRKSPGPGKGDRRCRLSRFAVKKSGRGGRLCYFAVKKSGRPSRLLGGPKGGSNLWKPLAGDRRAVLRESPTNPGPGVSNPNYACFAIERVMDRNDKSKENA